MGRDLSLKYRFGSSYGCSYNEFLGPGISQEMHKKRGHPPKYHKFDRLHGILAKFKWIYQGNRRLWEQQPNRSRFPVEDFVNLALKW